jgi:hypothetical protein
VRGLWNSDDAARYSGQLALRVYSSQLLGRDPSLVLHGGGNTSVKLREVNVLGEALDILYVKGSGWDLATIRNRVSPRCDSIICSNWPRSSRYPTRRWSVNWRPTWYAPALRHRRSRPSCTRSCRTRTSITRMPMRCWRSPIPPMARERVREIYGDDVVLIPLCDARLRAGAACARANFRARRMPARSAWCCSITASSPSAAVRRNPIADDCAGRPRANLSGNEPRLAPAGRGNKRGADSPAARRSRSYAAISPPAPAIRWYFATHGDAKFLAFAQRADVAQISQQGPATPDHVLSHQARADAGARRRRLCRGLP